MRLKSYVVKVDWLPTSRVEHRSSSGPSIGWALFLFHIFGMHLVTSYFPQAVTTSTSW
jgi:hypothetical protein